MAFTVSAAFSQYYESINLDGDHRATANTRRDDVVETLRGKGFHIIEAQAIGSIPRFTALKGHADVDAIVCLHYERHLKNRTPSEVMQAVRDALGEYRTNVRKNGQAVTLYYKTWPDVDIVPACGIGLGDTLLWYEIPDLSSGSWIATDPKAHDKNVEAKSTECGANFRRIVKIVKHWNITHGNYLQGYHIEVLALQTLRGNLDDLPWEIFQFFKDAEAKVATSLWYDISYADSYLSSEERQQVLSRWRTAVKRSSDAWYFGFKDREREAIEEWRKLFGDEFPRYG